MTTLERQVELTLSMLESACRELKASVSGDGRVDEATAARLLDVAPSTLANWRVALQGPAHYKGLGRRVSYRLADLAAWIERARWDGEFTKRH